MTDPTAAELAAHAAAHERVVDALIPAVGAQMPRGALWRPDPIADAVLEVLGPELETLRAFALSRQAEFADWLVERS